MPEQRTVFQQDAIVSTDFAAGDYLATRYTLQHLGLSPEQLRVVHNGIELDRFTAKEKPRCRRGPQRLQNTALLHDAIMTSHRTRLS